MSNPGIDINPPSQNETLPSGDVELVLPPSDRPSPPPDNWGPSIELQSALGAFKNTMECNFNLLYQQNTQKKLRDPIIEIFKATSRAFEAIETFISSMADERESLVKALETANTNVDKDLSLQRKSVKLAQLNRVETKNLDLSAQARGANLAVKVNQFKVPTGVSNLPAIKKSIGEKLAELETPNVPFSTI